MILNASYSSTKPKKLCKTMVIVGGKEVGKTSILQRYTKKRFDEAYFSTIGIDYYSKDVDVENASVTLSIWDTSGYENEFKILPSNVYKIAACYAIVCSYDIMESYLSLKMWINHILTYINSGRGQQNSQGSMIPIVVMINKSDIKSERQFHISDVAKVIEEFPLNIFVFEVSAKENNNIESVFVKIATVLLGGGSKVMTEIPTYSICEANTTIGTCIKNRTRSFQLNEDDSRTKKNQKKDKCCK